MAAVKNHYSATATSTPANFATASDTFSVVDLWVTGPPIGTVVEFILYEKLNPAAAAVAVRSITLSGPIVRPLARGIALKDGWYISHQKVNGGADGNVKLTVSGAT